VNEPDWLTIAREAYLNSTSYVDNNYRKQWEDNLRMFQSRHPVGSKYLAESYKHRSRLFRPKSRSVVRKNEAVTASAYFSNMDVISTAAQDDSNEAQQASAAIMKELLQYRLTKTVPWFMTLIGAMQDAQVTGVVCSYQYWDYKEKRIRSERPATDEMGRQYIDESGQPIMETVETVKIVRDKPCIELLPIETIRIDPAASWIDPINTSPYVIRMIPMYAGDVKAMMREGDPKTGQPKWKQLDEGRLREAINGQDDTTRQTREQLREDSKGNAKPVQDYEIIWVHENFVRRDDEEFVYYTLGTVEMLTDPKPLEEVYFHGERPIVMGCCVIETHITYPTSVVGLGTDLQKEANEIVNQRLDNVKLVLNKRWKVKRGKQVDIPSLLKNAAGSVSMVEAMDDVEEINWPDVTASSYAEQDRVNLDYDELVGNFSAGSVQSNRKMNETVGGMGLIASGANQMVEYLIRTFNETWVEPVLRQLVKLEQAYETDEVILALAGGKSGVFQKYGINQVTDALLNQELTLTVNVGIGATDPNLKMQKFIGAVSSFAEITAAAPPNANLEEISKEIFANAGYKDGARFFNKEVDPKVEMLTQQLQQMQQQLMMLQEQLKSRFAEKQLDSDTKLKTTQMNIIGDMEMQEKDLGFQYDKLHVDAVSARQAAYRG
jgi:hypothetical protein